jgi:hypothetical protein
MAINTYGGAYITGFPGDNTLSQVVIKAGWAITQSSNPVTVVKNIKNYYLSGNYVT